MKSITSILAGAVIVLSPFASQAITNTAIAISGTNIVLSWPSYGYESYLVQYRQTLDPSDSWSEVVNAYPANTNQTTYTLYGLVPPPASGGGNSMMAAAAIATANATGPMVIPADGSGFAVPLALYPPGSDLSGFLILDPLTGETVNGAGYSVSAKSSLIASAGASQNSGDSPLPMGDPSPADGPTENPSSPTTGFFRVFHIPDWLSDFSAYTFDGPTFIPVDFASPDAPADNVENSTVLINGQPTDIATLMPYVIGGVTNWGMGIYFDRLSNGTNTIQLITTVRQTDTMNDQAPYMVFSNAPVNITIGNFVTFTNWADLALSNTYTFKAQTAPNVDWEIDIYDVYNNFVNYETGHSSDGNIAWTWDFTDYWGNPRSSGNSDPFFFPYITISQTSGNAANGQVHPNGAGGSSSSWMPPMAAQFPDEGTWLFSYMDNFYTDGTTNYDSATPYFTDGINTMTGGPLEWGINTWLAALKYGRVYTQTNRDESWNSLRNDLQSWNARNFYYFGHGAANSIGGDISSLDSSNNVTGAKVLPGSKSYMSSQWVHDNVTFNKSFGAMPYRFVFLDGCNTAVGNWPWAWGVPKQSANVDWYKDSNNNPSGYRPNAFVGWDVTVGGNKDWGTVDKFWEFRKDWMGAWANEFQRQLNDAFSEAFSVSHWVASDHYGHLKVYGYTTMMFQEYNHAGNWP